MPFLLEATMCGLPMDDPPVGDLLEDLFNIGDLSDLDLNWSVFEDWILQDRSIVEKDEVGYLHWYIRTQGPKGLEFVRNNLDIQRFKESTLPRPSDEIASRFSFKYGIELLRWYDEEQKKGSRDISKSKRGDYRCGKCRHMKAFHICRPTKKQVLEFLKKEARKAKPMEKVVQNPQNTRKKQMCSKCGKPRKGHTCPNDAYVKVLARLGGGVSLDSAFVSSNFCFDARDRLEVHEDGNPKIVETSRVT